MSFITKRDRVFTEYDLFDLPARNEGKLKAYASCTDARAWSHFCSDKSEHLVEIIKRNNETCRPKYVPTDAIVNTLMAAKNAEINRLKHRIEEFEQMLAAYDQLELTCDQKCEIANAHASIKAANKELDELCLDLDLSGYTEGVDSEAFETGKSRGDEGSLHTAHQAEKIKRNEWETESEPTPMTDTKANQTCPAAARDATTSARDSRIDDLQDVIITKDAKLSAMQNTLAVMENDICEPYCIYAHIYTALEKIFGTLCQNSKYKEYLDLLTVGKDTRGIDVKGKILFKLKVLEKFSLALIAPCSQDYPNQPKQECSCYSAQVETTFALTPPATKTFNLDSKRAILVADIMENNEIKEILSKDSVSSKIDDYQIDDSIGVESYSIETENLNRLKNLQANYEDLLNCYEQLKYEKNCLQIKCKKYEELEKDFEILKNRLQEYKLLYNEKEHYRKRSEDLDVLKEKFIVLSEEAANIETQLKAESQINNMKSKAVDELRSENIVLEKKLNDMSISFEKEKNILTCKLKECECKIMCQDQQIKSLSMQIDQLLEQDKVPTNYDSTRTLELTDQIESLKQQVKNLQNVIFCDEEEKHQLQKEFAKKLELINNLKMEIEEWKSNFDKAVQSQNYLEKYTKKYQDEMQILKEENKTLLKDKEKQSQEINNVMIELEQKKNENRDLYFQLQRAKETFDNSLSSLETEKQNALFSIQLVRTDSQKLIGNLEEPHSHENQEDSTNSEHDISGNKRSLLNRERGYNVNSILLREIQNLREENVTNITKLQEENTLNKKSLEILKTESTTLQHKLFHFESLSQQFINLKESHEKLIEQKINLENELHQKTSEIEHLLLLKRKESDSLIDRLQHSKNLQDELSISYQEIAKEKYSLLSDLSIKNEQLRNITEKINEIKEENKILHKESQRLHYIEQEMEKLNNAYMNLQNKCDDKSKEIEKLNKKLDDKIEENRELNKQIKNLHYNDLSSKNSISALNTEKYEIQTNLNTLKKQHAELIDKVKYYENIENELCELKHTYDQVILDNEKLHKDIEIKIIDLNNLQDKNRELNSYSQKLLNYNGELEKSLSTARNELLSHSENPQEVLSIKEEIEKIKHERSENLEKIKKLWQKVDESEYIICNLKEDLIAREDKIALLQNHINELQDEVQRLHATMANLTETSEQIKDYSLQNIEQSLKRMEAHHSKATHNMRSELAKLQDNNSTLESQVSESMLKREESIRDMNKYYLQISSLKNERAAVVSDIKHLEIKIIGDSNLSNNSTVEDVLLSIKKIAKCFESRESKNTSLEKTLLKVQSSFQLVLDKVDEEKRNIDEENKKIQNEKEAAIVELQNIQKEFEELKQKYEEQTLDRRLINNLQAEILNQNLIIEKINKSKADYISKLQDEIKSLQSMYETSISRVRELQDKMKCMSVDNKKHMGVIEEINRLLEEKCKEIVDLQNALQNLKDKSVHSVSTQVENIVQIYVTQSTQTSNDNWNENYVTDSVAHGIFLNSKDNFNYKSDFSENSKSVMTDILPKNELYPFNEVQILRANVELPSSNCNADYINYKMKQLDFGPTEQHSIPSFNNIQDSIIEKSSSNDDKLVSTSALQETFTKHNHKDKSNTIDVYNIQPLYVSSPKAIIKSIDKNNTKTSKIVRSFSSNSLSDIKYRKDTENNIHDVKLPLKQPKSEDLLVIYTDNDKPIMPQNQLLEIYNRDHEQHNNYSNESEIPKKQNNIQRRRKNKKPAQIINLNRENEVSVSKPKLKIELPRLKTESSSLNNTSDGDNKSLDSYTYAIYSLPKRSTYSDTNVKNKQDSSNILLCGSPDTMNELSHEERINDLLIQNEIESSRIESNNQSSSKVENSLLRVGSYSSCLKNSSIHKPDLLRSDSHHKLSRVGANVLLLEYSDGRSTNDTNDNKYNDSQETLKSVNFGLQYILDTMKSENDPRNESTYNHIKSLKDISSNGTKSYKKHYDTNSPENIKFEKYTNAITVPNFNKTQRGEVVRDHKKTYGEFGVLVKMDSVEDYENKIHTLTKALENIEKDYKKKIEAVKVQYDNNIKNIINEHNLGVKSIQSLHEDTMLDVIKIHENEVENLRTMSIEALRRVKRLEKENYSLKSKMYENTSLDVDKEPVKISTPEYKRSRGRSRLDTKALTKTSVEAYNVKPSTKHGPCTCSVDMNISDTIRNIFEQVDVEQRKVAENAYLKYIANKISNNNIDTLDAQELSFLHLKVCRTWKTKLSKEEALQRKIDSLESELINKQRQAQIHMAELDRKVTEERRRLREVREAVCGSSPAASRDASPQQPPPPVDAAVEASDRDCCVGLKILGHRGQAEGRCNCSHVDCPPNVSVRRSAGDLAPGLSGVRKQKRTKMESNRVVLAKLDTEERRDRKFYDDPPIRLKRSHDRPTFRKK